MEMREILYVHKVAQLKNMTKASHALHISQPSLSQSIIAIEKKIGQPLFIRTKRGVTLTETGQQFISDSYELLLQYDRFAAKLNDYSKGPLTHYLGLYKLSHTTAINNAIMNFISRDSENHYVLKVEDEGTLEAMLLSNQLDLAIIKCSPLHKRNPSLHYEPIFQKRLCVLLSQSNPLADQAILDIPDLKGNRLITSEKNEYPYQMIAHLLKKADIELEVHTYMNYANMAVIMNLVENNFGITFGTEDVCSYYATPNMSCIPLKEAIYYEICLVQKKSAENLKPNKALIDAIYEFAAASNPHPLK